MSRNLPPKSNGIFLLGNILDFLKDPFEYVKMVSSHGDVVRVNLAGTLMHYVFHPDYVDHILLKNANNYTKGSLMKRTQIVFGNGLILSEGEEWKVQRKRMAHSFSHSFVARLADPIALLAGHHLNAMEGERNLDEDFMGLTLELVMRLLFGNTLGEDLDKLSEAFQTISVHFSKIMSQVPVPLWIPIPRNVRYNRAMRNMEEVVQRILDERRTGGGSQGEDILSRIIEESDDFPAMDESLIHDEIRTLLLAGHETTSLALTYSAWFLSDELELQDSIAAEVSDVTGGQPVQGVHFKDLESVGNTVREAIRILPPAPIFGREAIADDKLGEYDIPAGANVILCPLRTQNDPRWFPEPERFNPRRWTPEFKESLPRFAYYPFGGGRRICIGMHLAMMEATLILAELLRRYRIHRTPESVLELLPAITLSTKVPVKLRLEKR
jgi:cytochrome P450